MKRLVAVLAVAALLTGGCSDDGDDDPSSQGGGTPRSERPERDKKHRDVPEPRRWEPNAPIHVIPWHPATSARRLADRLFAAEHQSRAPYNVDVVVESAAFETQLLYRQLARTPEWQEPVLRRMRGLRPVAELHLAARASLRSVLSTLSDELPAWEIIPSAPLADLRRYYREGEREFGVPWELLAAINMVESSWGKIHGLSTAGAQGPMQFIPSTWAAYGEGDIDDPHDAILAAARYLAANGAARPGDVEDALYAYNNHPGYVAGISAYADIIERDPRALRGLYHWQVIYLSVIGDIWLALDYFETAPVPVRAYVRQHPERHLGTATD